MAKFVKLVLKWITDCRNCGRNFRRNLIFEAKILHVYRNRVLSRFYVQQFPVKISRGFETISNYFLEHFVYRFF